MPDFNPSPLERARLFLQYAYVSEPGWEILRQFADEDFRALKQELAQLGRAELIERMRRAAFAVFEQCFAGAGGEIVVPLSGGKDSRLILCMALELGLKERVLAVSWGVPGGLDYEIARKVASRLGVRHEAIVTTEQRVSFDDLKRAYDNGARWSDLLLAHFNQMWRRIAPGSCAVIGYLGGPTVGAHYTLGDERLDYSAALRCFELTNRKASGRSNMIREARDRLVAPDLVPYPEQLDLVFRQEGYLRRVVAQEQLGARAPFAHPDWVRFGYALPPHCRAGHSLFTEFVFRCFPRAFEIGVSGAYGLPINARPGAVRLQRHALRAAHAARNVMRKRGFATLDKYGDARDFAETLTAEAPAPAAYLRALRRPAGGPAEAAAWRRRAMLLCNLACERDQRASVAVGDSVFAEERTGRACAPSA